LNVLSGRADAADVAGSTDALPIVFLHAASYTRKMWLPQTQHLRNEFRTIALDLPGHGTRAGTPFTFRAAVHAVHEMLAQEKIARAVFVGVSLGGCLAMDYAAQHPDHVAGLVLSGCTFDPRTVLCRLVLTGESLVFPRGAKAFTRALTRFLESRFPAIMAAEMIAAGTYWVAAAHAVKAMRGRDFLARLGVYPGPTLILNGERDWVHRLAERTYAAVAQDARIQIISGGGHVASLDQPDAFADAVRNFANSLLR
jgi:pimeloyl-ACP methyl ester carboxylesterase